MNSSLDPRVIRTRRLLISALIDLIILENLDFVNIRKIVEKAEVNRSTFYLHFIDKQDIVMQMQEEVLVKLGKIINNPTYEYQSALNDYKKNTPIHGMSALFNHIQENASFYQKMLNDKSFLRKFTSLIEDEVFKFRESKWEATYMANGTVGIIKYWLEDDMKEETLDMSLWLTKITLFPLGKFE